MLFRSAAARLESNKRSRGSTIAINFLVALVFLTLCMDRFVTVFDEGLILTGAALVANGDVPHRDFYTLYAPGQFYVVAALFKSFGASVLIERAWDTIVRATCVVLVLIIVGQAASRRLAVRRGGQPRGSRFVWRLWLSGVSVSRGGAGEPRVPGTGAGSA